MAYPNTTPASAVTITPDAVLTVDPTQIDPDQGAWYKFTTGTFDYLISVRAVADPGDDTYALFYDSDGTTQSIMHLAADSSDPIVQPVNAETLYYMQLFPDGTPGSAVTFTLTPAPLSAIPAGSILIPDDDFPIAAVAFSSVDGTTLRGLPYSAGENADVLPNGRSLSDARNSDVFSHFDLLELWDGQLNKLLSIPNPFGNLSQIAITSDQVDRFYIANPTGIGTANTYIKEVDQDGTIVQTWGPIALTDGFSPHLAVKPGGRVVYLSPNGAPNLPIVAYDLDSSTLLGTFIAGMANHTYQDIICLPDGTFCVMAPVTGGADVVLHFDTDGSYLQTYTHPNGNQWNGDHIFRNGASTTDFWWWIERFGFGHKFMRVRVSDGAILQTIDKPFADGYLDPTNTTELFGASQSCPGLVLMQDIPAPPEPCFVDSDAALVSISSAVPAGCVITLPVE